MEIIDLELKTLQSRHDFQSQGQMTLKIQVKFKGHHMLHLILVIICTKYGKNPSRTVDATERTRFSRSRLNDLENIGQGQRSFYATHPLILVIICAKYGKNPSRIVDFVFKVKVEIFFKNCHKFKLSDAEKNVTHDTSSNNSDHLCHI